MIPQVRLPIHSTVKNSKMKSLREKQLGECADDCAAVLLGTDSSLETRPFLVVQASLALIVPVLF
jgi:hypothetical protein